ncbi:hypothetical protein [Bradyrhizobium sp. BR 1432]|uniref:hypothetical protein n=1 Tax=Bradyrhizobium sp. BR 1432 TaxID=3447966 RepID=UPI003EE65750
MASRPQADVIHGNGHAKGSAYAELFIIKSRHLQVAQERANEMRCKPKYEGHKSINRRAEL